MLNTLMAFVLNAMLPVILKEVSAMGMTLCGVCKDVAIVVLSSAVFAAPLHHQQMIAFSITLVGVSFWSFVQSNSDQILSKPVDHLFGTSAKAVGKSPSETTPLTA